ncbi:MAG: hypothetical protein HOM37_06375, partial [Acidimicrobiaceae bacterium]|nr:hypothetical protein [Acidimicrobiaceae bacterium]
ALAVAPIVSELLDGLSNQLWNGEIGIGNLHVQVPGVRLTLWLSSTIIVAAGVLASWSLRAGSGAFLSELSDGVEESAQ